MTLTTTTTTEPDYIEDLLRGRMLRALYWSVGEPERLDPENEDDPILVADLTVIFHNGRRTFRADATLELGVIYGLVGNDEISRDSAEWAIDTLLEKAQEIPEHDVILFAEDDRFAEALGTWRHTDADLVRAAAPAAAAKIDGEWGALLLSLVPLVARIRMDEEFTLADPEVQMAAQAVRIAWDLL